MPVMPVRPLRVETTESSAMRRLEAEGDVCGFDHDVAGGDRRYYDAEDNVWSLDDSSVAVGDRILDAENNIPGFVNQDHSVMEDETMLSNDAEGYAQSLVSHRKGSQIACQTPILMSTLQSALGLQNV
ncbi:uncharacterized protein [Dysidea avara]|uniref:uncharacterized protein isoform X2 n=1 Tax=Dysidea avara TaxID=196820 RepID=UPI003328321A